MSSMDTTRAQTIEPCQLQAVDTDAYVGVAQAEINDDTTVSVHPWRTFAASTRAALHLLALLVVVDIAVRMVGLSQAHSQECEDGVVDTATDSSVPHNTVDDAIGWPEHEPEFAPPVPCMLPNAPRFCGSIDSDRKLDFTKCDWWSTTSVRTNVTEIYFRPFGQRDIYEPRPAPQLARSTYGVDECNDEPGVGWRAIRIGPLPTRGGYTWQQVTAIMDGAQTSYVAAYAMGNADEAVQRVGFPPIHQHHFMLYGSGDVCDKHRCPTSLTKNGQTAAPTSLRQSEAPIDPAQKTVHDDWATTFTMNLHGDSQCHQEEGGAPRRSARSWLALPAFPQRVSL